MNGDALGSPLADRYTIERELGRGGNAIVYLAHDLKHGRKVALKVLAPELAHAVRTERFLREIQIAAKLTHPHILMLIDSGEAGGFLYYVMPYVEGESLRDRLVREKQLPVEDALRITRDVAEALSYAHAHGVVHRDVKPENILLSEGGAVVADFGIARALMAAGSGTASEAGHAVGTPAYMAPEQASGGAEPDGRSDIYSLGCVLYEMLAGHVPFPGDTAQEVLARHALDPVPGLRAARPGVPRTAERAVARALAKVPADRFASAAAFAGALAPPPRRVPVYVAGGLLVLVGAAVVAQRTLLRAPSEQSVAVLPFVNMSGDAGNEYFSDGMTEDLIDALTQVRRLRVPARTSSFVFKGKNVPVLDIGRQLNVAHVVEGSVRRAGNQVRVTAQLINVADGYHLWSQHYERKVKSARDIFTIQDEISRAIVTALQVKLTRADTAPSRPHTDDLDAYDLYQRGRYQWYRRTREGTKTAIVYFKQAIRLDSTYALAYSGLADAYETAGQGGTLPKRDVYPRAKQAALRAVALDPGLSEAYVSLARVRQMFDWDFPAAEAAFRHAIQLNPRYALAHSWYGYFLALTWPKTRVEEAVRETRLGLELDPLNAAFNNNHSIATLYAGRPDEALEYSRKAVDLAPDWTTAHSVRANHYAKKGMYAEALREMETAQRLGGRRPGLLASIAGMHARMGQTTEARGILRDLEGRRRDPNVLGPLAVLYLTLGDTARALDAIRLALERPYESFVVPNFYGPIWGLARADARIAPTLEKLGVGRDAP